MQRPIVYADQLLAVILGTRNQEICALYLNARFQRTVEKLYWEQTIQISTHMCTVSCVYNVYTDVFC